MLSIGFLGAGQMAEAMAVGFINRGGVERDRIHFCDPAPARIKIFTDLGANHCQNNIEVAKQSQIVFVAVKPHYVMPVLEEIKPVLNAEHIVISIAAGITLQKLVSVLGNDVRFIRLMPNTPCLVGEMAAGMCLGGKVRSQI